MLNKLLKIYVTHRKTIAISLFSFGFLLVILAVILKVIDDKHPSRRDKIYCENQISKLNNQFEIFSTKWFNSEIDQNSELFNKSISKFNKYNCVVALYKHDSMVYLSSNAVEPDSVSRNIIANNNHYHFTGSRQTIPIIKRHGDECALLLITLATQNSNVPRIDKIELNKKLIPSQNIQITSYSELGEKISTDSGKHLFSFTYNSRSDSWILIDILLTIGLVLITLTISPYISHENYKNAFTNITFSIFAIISIIFLIDIFSITNRLLWIVPIIFYIYTNIIFHTLKKLRCMTNHCHCNIPMTFRLSYNMIIPLYAVILSLTIIYAISKCNDLIYIYIIPIIILTAGYLNLLWSFNIVNKKNRSFQPFLVPIINIIIAVTISYFTSTKLFHVILLIIIPTLLILILHKRLNRITIFYITTISISTACAYILLGIETVSIFGTNYSQIETSQQLNFYMSLISNAQNHTISPTGIRSLQGHFSIILYTAITIIASTILLLEQKIYRVRKNSMSRKVHFTLYMTIIIILSLSIILSTNFVRNIKQESVNMYINRICNSIVIDYIDNCTDLESWINKRETNYNININIYSKNGALMYHSVKDPKATTLIPKRLNSELVKKINQYPNKNHIFADTYLSRINYISAYASIPGNLILHIPFEEQHTMQNFNPMISKFINIFICSLLVLLFITTIIYNKLTHPLEILNKNMDIMRARKRISKKDFSSAGNSEVAAIIKEYNKMITELDSQYRLQITVERQSTWNKLIRLIAHEVKNPLTPILLKAQMIQYRKAIGDQTWLSLVDETLNIIVEQTKRISGLITTMTESPEKYIGTGEQIDVIPMLENIKSFYSAYSRINFNIINHTPDVDATIFFNRDNLWSVISNITTNAIDAIISKNTINGTISFFVTTTENKLTIKIYNNGITIPEEIISKIFDFSFTTKTDGSGLGLYLVHQIIKVEDGSISVISSDDIGTEFTIIIPRHKKEVKGTIGKIAHLE